MLPRTCVLVVATALCWGCASAEGAYHDGMELEVAGDYAAAADAYALALERDRDLLNVSGRLAVAGREAVARWVASASAAEPVGAADAYLAADALVVRARAVGVELERPGSFDADRDAAFSAAVETLLADAEVAVAQEGYGAALHALDRARAYRPSPAQRTALDRSARRAYAGWAEADYVAGRYRAAYGRAQSALALYAPDEPGADSVLDLLDDIVAAGTVLAAVFPAESDDDLPRGLLRDFDDVLLDDELTALPPLVALLDPAEVRRQSRREDRDVRRPIRSENRRDLIDDPRRAAAFARNLGVDVGVAVAFGPVVAERAEGEAVEDVTAHDGDEAVTYQRRRVSLHLTARASFVAVSAVTRRVVCEGEVEEEGRDRYQAASYRGDWRDLSLSRSERALFTADDDARGRLLADLRDDLAAELAAGVVRCLERQVL